MTEELGIHEEKIVKLTKEKKGLVVNLSSKKRKLELEAQLRLNQKRFSVRN